MNPEDLIQQLEQSNIELFQMGEDDSILDICALSGNMQGELIASTFPDNMPSNTLDDLNHNIGFKPEIPGLS